MSCASYTSLGEYVFLDIRLCDSRRNVSVFHMKVPKNQRLSSLPHSVSSLGHRSYSRNLIFFIPDKMSTSNPPDTYRGPRHQGEYDRLRTQHELVKTAMNRKHVPFMQLNPTAGLDTREQQLDSLLGSLIGGDCKNKALMDHIKAVLKVGRPRVEY